MIYLVIKYLVQWWDRYWFEKIPPYPLAAFRIAYGFFLLVSFLAYLPVVPDVFSNEGVYVPSFVPEWAPSPEVSWILYFVFIGIIIFFILGYKTRVITPLLLGGFLHYYFLNLAAKNFSYDRINIILLLVLCFADLDKAWSLESLRTKRRRKDMQVTAWANRLICLFVAITYFGMSFYKWLSPQWHTGTMLMMNLHSEWGTPLGFWIVQQNYPPVFYTLMTWSVIILEFVCCFALYIHSLQKVVFVLATLLHLSIAAMINIPEFLFLPACYLLYVKPEKLKAFGDQVIIRIQGAGRA